MSVRLAALAAVLALVLLGAGLWRRGALTVPAGAARRSLACYRVERMPPVPEAWWSQLRARLDAAPTLSLLDPQASAIVSGLFQEVAWIDPASVEVQARLPEGFRVLFLPRRPLLQLTDGPAVAAVVDRAGVVLPAGVPEAALGELLAVPLDRNVTLPEAGRALADPLLAEALRAAPEAYALRQELGLDLARIERQRDYPAEAPGVPPALSFVLRDGRSILWGRSEAAGATLTPPRARKEARLRALLARYPQLHGVQTVVLDRERVRALDASGADLPLPDPMP
ncbi:MAG: hypothetical protein EYC70_11135 [Planctomycetota bacterium]|nr:MAG: hypothetical protein EYC70_11135 [Planctomycetota bacterium]